MATPAAIQPAIPAKRPLRVREFPRMIEMGVLGGDDRLELVDGEIYTMPPTGPWHVVERGELRDAASRPRRNVVADDFAGT
ncbi:MAG TPA: hypothetical protein VLE20_03415 [Blastocatellia bacterium]|nr:hypothetical protein [Blastocatellia bacterium]